MQRILRSFTTSRPLANTQAFFRVSDVQISSSSITGEIIDNAIDLTKVRPGANIYVRNHGLSR